MGEFQSFVNRKGIKTGLVPTTGLPLSARHTDLQNTAAGQLIGSGAYKPDNLGVHNAEPQESESEGPWREPRDGQQS